MFWGSNPVPNQWLREAYPPFDIWILIFDFSTAVGGPGASFKTTPIVRGYISIALTILGFCGYFHVRCVKAI